MLAARKFASVGRVFSNIYPNRAETDYQQGYFQLSPHPPVSTHAVPPKSMLLQPYSSANLIMSSLATYPYGDCLNAYFRTSRATPFSQEPSF